MKNTKKILPLATLCLVLPACLENEEKIEVHADGSLRVELSAKGQVFDLAGGYPIPLDPSWRSLGDSTDFWLQNVGASTGHEVRDNVRACFPPEPDGKQPQSELRVAREFASVADWPRWYAPESEPYRTAFLERSATLEIKEQEARTVYVFERTYRGVDYARLDIDARLDEELGESFWKRLEQPNALDEQELVQVRDAVADIHMDVAEMFVRDALLGVYTEGDASLAAGEIPGLVQDVRAAAGGLIDVPLVRRVNALIATEDEENLGHLAEDLETRFRDTLRESLAEGLSDRGLEPGTVNAVLFALEWGFTAFDHYGDLSDESFLIEVSMPGVLVGGNFHESEGQTAAWHFEGEALQQRDLTLRVVSVLENGAREVRRR